MDSNESQVFGYESAIRQFTFGQKTLLEYTGKKAQTYIVEEQIFFRNYLRYS